MQIFACSSGVSASMFTASNARSSHVEPSGSGAPECRFFAYRLIARSQKSSFSTYSAAATRCSTRAASAFVFFPLDSDSVARFHASLFATASVTASNTPCGHALRRKSNHSWRLMCASPVDSHSASIFSRLTSKTLDALDPSG